jgi:hypothetical protein
MKIRTQLVALMVIGALPGAVLASAVDFEDVNPLGVQNGLALPDASLSYGGAGGAFYVVDSANASWVISGAALTGPMPDPEPNDPEPGPYVGSDAAFRVDFGVAVNSVEISFGDYCDGFAGVCDLDTGYLQAFDSGGNLLDEAMLATEDGGVLSLLVAGVIDHVLFWSTSDFLDPESDQYAHGSVYWDNLRYGVAEVPLPGTLGLMGLGLMGLGLIRRKAS